MKKLLQLSSYPHFEQFVQKASPLFGYGSLICLVVAWYGGLVLAPADYQQGDAFRIMYVHVPSATLSMGLYVFISLMSVLFYVWKLKVADVLAKVAAPLGGSFTLLALITGAIWGKPMWGTWWVWDARLTSELVLGFLFLGLMGLRHAIEDPLQSGRACALLGMIGIINLPIIHYSVVWWHTLHQPPSLLALQKPTIAGAMLWPLVLSLLGFVLYSIFVLLLFAKKEIQQRQLDMT